MSNQINGDEQNNKTKDSDKPVYLYIMGTILIVISLITKYFGITGNNNYYGYDNTQSYMAIGSSIGLFVIAFVLFGLNRIICLLIDIKSINEIVFFDELNRSTKIHERKEDSSR